MIRFKILPDLKLTVVQTIGEVTGHEVREVLQKLYEQPLDRTGYNNLTIATQGHVAMSSDDMYFSFKWLSRNDTEKNKVAIVVSDGHGFGVSRMWSSHVENNIPHQVQIFHYLADACAWLDVPLQEIERVVEQMG